MNKSTFRFKQFSIDQDGSAMKINTDGVLLAAKAISVAPQYILDIGAGTGVIALMLAQRFPEAVIHALEINEAASLCAEKNFRNSPFSDRLTLFHTDFQEFVPKVTYDLIVSNPPFFINSLKNPDLNKTMARHTQFAFFENLFSKTYGWLRDNGSFQLIWPLISKQASVENGLLSQWTIQEEINIRSFEHSEVIRVISTLSKQKNVNSTEDFVIYKEKGNYSLEYLELLKPFFLSF
jgi:tRNA1Val (adenine37-N6)-methyltransferase